MVIPRDGGPSNMAMADNIQIRNGRDFVTIMAIAVSVAGEK